MKVQTENGSDTRKSKPDITEKEVEKKKLEFWQEITKHMTRGNNET